MENEKKNLDQSTQAGWRGAIALFGQISTWVVAPIVLALVFGKMLDTHYGTRPIIFLVLAGVGFLFTCFGIVRVMKRYIKEIKDLSAKK